jgi:hypothetical protein
MFFNQHIFMKIPRPKLTGVSTKNISELSQTLSSVRIRFAGCSFSLISSPVCESSSDPSFCIISLMSSSKRLGLGGTYLNKNKKNHQKLSSNNAQKKNSQFRSTSANFSHCILKRCWSSRKSI